MACRLLQTSHRHSHVRRFDASCMSRRTKGQCPNPTSRDTSGAQSMETMRLSASDDPRHPSISCVKLAIRARIMHSGTLQPKYRISRSESESHHVGVSHRAAQRWFDLLLPAHGYPHSSRAVTAAKPRKRGTNRHNFIFFRPVAPPDMDARRALRSRDVEELMMARETIR